MLRHPIFVAVVVTAYLVVYCIITGWTLSESTAAWLFAPSPLLVVWLAVAVLKDKKYKAKDLKEGEEWGYGDRDRNSLGMF